MLQRMFLVLVVVALAACSTDGNSYQGRVVAAAKGGDDSTSERWIVTVDLDSGVVSGSKVVQVAFDASELACADATRVSPEELQSEPLPSSQHRQPSRRPPPSRRQHRQPRPFRSER